MQVLLSFLEGTGFARLRTICGTKDCCAIFMAHLTEVSHWLHNNNQWQQCLPKATKGRIGDRTGWIPTLSSAALWYTRHMPLLEMLRGSNLMSE